MFDARAAKVLPAGQHITFSDYPGLRFSASATKRTWIYRYKSPVDNRMRQIAIGHWPEMSFPAAIVAWEALRDDRDAGIDPALEKKQKRAEVKAAVQREQEKAVEQAYTVRVLCDDYLAGHIMRNRAKKGATEAERMFDKMLGDLSDVPAVDVTRAMAFDLINAWAEKAPVNAGRLRCELGAAWDFAIDAGRLPETAPNWWRLILRGKIRSKGKMQGGVRVTSKRVLSEDEVGELINWLPNFSQNLEDILTLYLWTATRGSEIVTMTGAEIRDEDGQMWWVIPKEKTKNARHEEATDQRVPLFGRARAIVIRRKKLYGDGFLFPATNKSGPLDQKVVSQGVHYHQPYSKTRPECMRHRLTVSHWAPHDLRRTSRTLLAKLGCPDSVGEAILGHMLPGVVGTYNRHKYDVERVEWLSRLSDYLEGLV